FSMLWVPTPPPTASGTAPDKAATVMHAGRLTPHPFSATKTSTPPAVSLTNRLMTLSLSRGWLEALCLGASQIARAGCQACCFDDRDGSISKMLGNRQWGGEAARLPEAARSVQFRPCGWPSL